MTDEYLLFAQRGRTLGILSLATTKIIFTHDLSFRCIINDVIKTKQDTYYVIATTSGFLYVKIVKLKVNSFMLRESDKVYFANQNVEGIVEISKGMFLVSVNTNHSELVMFNIKDTESLWLLNSTTLESFKICDCPY